MALASSAIAEPPSGYSYSRPSSFGGLAHGSSFSSGGGGGYSSGGRSISPKFLTKYEQPIFSQVMEVDFLRAVVVTHQAEDTLQEAEDTLQEVAVTLREAMEVVDSEDLDTNKCQ